MALSARTLFQLTAFDSATSPVSGGLTAITTFESQLTDGTTANKADLVSKTVQTIPLSDNADIDLRALTDIYGDAMTGLAEIVALVLESASTNGGLLSIKPASSNGWLGLLADASDVLKLQPGARVILYAAGDGLYTVGASTKAINVANADTAAATLTITLIGRSA